MPVFVTCRRLGWVAAPCVAFLAGCAGTKEEPGNEAPEPTRLERQMEYMDARQEEIRELERADSRPLALDPVMPEYDPLDDVVMSLEMDREDVRHVLMVLAEETGMNLMVHPDIVADPPLLSVSFRDMPASTVFRRILESTDLHGRIEDNLLYVTPYETAVFHLDFIDTSSSVGFSAGGNVLGGSTDAAAGALGGSFTIDGSGPASTNPYDHLESVLDSVLGRDAGYQLHRMAGVLHVRARPSEMDTVRDLIARYQQTLGRQILIEARIMEVRLSDDFRSGVNWGALRRRAGTAFGAESGTMSVTDAGGELPGLTLSPEDDAFSLMAAGERGAAVLQMLETYGAVEVLSNPSVRAKHGRPSLISVGRSSAYIRETSVTESGVGQDTRTRTQVDVDTVFDGLLVGVLPIVTDNGSISLTVHPVQSNVDEASLAGTTIDDQGSIVALPRVDIKEISTQLDLEDGDTVILGGLIDRTRREERSGIPLLSRIPGLRYLFSRTAEVDQVSELVLMINVRLL